MHPADRPLTISREEERHLGYVLLSVGVGLFFIGVLVGVWLSS